MNVNKTSNLKSFNPKKGLNREASFIKEICWFLVKRFFFITALPYPNSFKSALLKLFGAKVGKGVVIKPFVNIHMPWKLTIGNYVWIGDNVYLHSLDNILIRDNVCISQEAMLLTGNHNYTFSSFDYRNAPIILEDGVWVGAKSVVCPGVKCRSHSILAVGSIATKNMEPYTIYQGNPAQAIRKREIKA